ncbi:hypothetical protein D3C87_1682760 [compost metagenome]
MAHRDDAVARRNEGENGGRNGGHAAGKTQRIFCALQLCQHLFEHPHGRVQPSRIDRPHLFAAIGGNHFVVAGKGEKRGLHKRRDHSFESVGLVMGDDQGGGIEEIVALVHFDMSLISSSTTARIFSVSSRAVSASPAAMALNSVR